MEKVSCLVCLEQGFLKCLCAQNHLEGLLKQVAGHPPTPGVWDSAGLRSGPRTCLSNKFLGDAEVAGPEATLRLWVGMMDPLGNQKKRWQKKMVQA